MCLKLENFDKGLAKTVCYFKSWLDEIPCLIGSRHVLWNSWNFFQDIYHAILLPHTKGVGHLSHHTDLGKSEDRATTLSGKIGMKACTGIISNLSHSFLWSPSNIDLVECLEIGTASFLGDCSRSRAHHHQICKLCMEWWVKRYRYRQI